MVDIGEIMPISEHFIAPTVLTNVAADGGIVNNDGLGRSHGIHGGGGQILPNAAHGVALHPLMKIPIRAAIRWLT